MLQHDMKPKALIVCSDSPYPVVVGGYERLISDYQRYVFCDYDVYLLVCHCEGECELLHYGTPVPRHLKLPFLFEEKFEFSLFIHPDIDFNDRALIGPLADRIPSFCFVQRHPEKQINEALFRGILTHLSDRPHGDLLRIGGSYNPEVFYKKRSGEDYVLCVARIYPEKNQLELVRAYKEKIYDRFGLPLYLVGGTENLEYFEEVERYIDGVAVIGTADRKAPMQPNSWRTAAEIAELCSRARLFVMASPRESFCIAMIEAMACGLTCVVNGNYFGFDREELRPNVFGPITRKRGPIVDTIASALERDVRIDASEWVKKFSVDNTREKLLGFIKARL
jgi:glycosyltransferase involved in cell wall biosynthesis